jgi:hypothetical protein
VEIIEVYDIIPPFQCSVAKFLAFLLENSITARWEIVKVVINDCLMIKLF